MIDRFITYIESERRYSKLTAENYRRDLTLFAEWFVEQRALEQFDATAVTAEDIRDYIIYRIDTARLKHASMNREISTLRSFFRYMRKIEVVKTDIMKKIGSLKAPKVLPVFVPETKLGELLGDVEEQSWAKEFREQRSAVIISLLYGCGIRLAELLGIELQHISNGALKVHGKGDKQRIIPLQTELIARIDRYTTLCRENGLTMENNSKLIIGSTGKPLSRITVQRIVAQELSAAGIQGRKSPHVLRHTFATQLLAKGAGMREIQELMGHASLTSTQHYTHTDIGQLQGAYDSAHPHR